MIMHIYLFNSYATIKAELLEMMNNKSSKFTVYEGDGLEEDKGLFVISH